MKTAKDPRHLNRLRSVQDLYAVALNPTHQITPLAKQVQDNISAVDSWVKLAAPARPLEQINKLDLAILRLAIYELMVEKSAPYKVIVDEAVELAKRLGSDTTPGFINGALGHLIKETGIDQLNP